MKRANGTGAIYKLSGKRRRPFIVVITAGWEKQPGEDGQGKQLKKIIGYYATSIEAEAALIKCYNAPIDKLDITLEGLYTEWSEWKYKAISKDTEAVHKAAWLKLEPLKTLKVRNIRTSQLQSCVDRHVHQSRSSLEKIRSLAVMLWDNAMENDIVDKNYAKFIRLPKTEESTRDAFTEIERAKIEKAAKDGSEAAGVIMVLCYTGFRINELLSLTKFNYDKDNKLLTGGSKTEAGKNRSVPIHPKIQPYIDHWIAKGKDYIFCSPNGGKYTDNNFRNRLYYPALEEMGLRKLSPHCCRHTFASLCEKAEITNFKIEKLIGHADYKMTKKYTHTDIQELREAIEKLP